MQPDIVIPTISLVNQRNSISHREPAQPHFSQGTSATPSLTGNQHNPTSHREPAQPHLSQGTSTTPPLTGNNYNPTSLSPEGVLLSRYQPNRDSLIYNAQRIIFQPHRGCGLLISCFEVVILQFEVMSPVSLWSNSIPIVLKAQLRMTMKNKHFLTNNSAEIGYWANWHLLYDTKRKCVFRRLPL